ncbi:MAG: alanine racemase [Ignavibacteriaceae bacterium]
MLQFKEIDTPALLVDLDKLDNNLNRMALIAKANKVNLRPHSKMHKTPEVAKRQIEVGAIGITVQKLGEAEVMFNAGLNNILIAYELIGEQKLSRLINLKKQGCNIITAVDSIESAELLSKKIQDSNLSADVVIEVNTGLNRCGILAGERVLHFAQNLSKYSNINIRGIFTHEGHVYNGKNLEEIRSLSLKAGKEMTETGKLLRNHGFNIDIISVGSTPSAYFIGEIDGITELRPGVYAFNDITQVNLGTCSIDNCALTVLSTVVSRPSPTRAIIDAGVKAMSAVSSMPNDGTLGLIKGYNNIKFDLESSEEHGILYSDNAIDLKIGDKIEIIPNHACTTVNMHDELYIVKNNKVIDIWKIAARGKMK